MLGNWIVGGRSLRRGSPLRRNRRVSTVMDKRRQFFHPACEMLEARCLLATLDFVGLDLTFNARAGIANTVTLSQSGDTYTFTTDSADKITAFNNCAIEL